MCSLLWSWLYRACTRGCDRARASARACSCSCARVRASARACTRGCARVRRVCVYVLVLVSVFVFMVPLVFG